MIRFAVISALPAPSIRKCCPKIFLKRKDPPYSKSKPQARSQSRGRGHSHMFSLELKHCPHSLLQELGACHKIEGTLQSKTFLTDRALKPKFVPKPGRISHVRHVSRSRPSLGFFTGGIWKRDELPARSASYCALGALPFTGYDFPAALGSFEALKKPMPVPPVADVGFLKTCESDVGVYLSSLDNIPNSTPKFWGQRGNLNPTLDLELKLQTQSRPRVQSSGYRAFWTQHHLSLKP